MKQLNQLISIGADGSHPAIRKKVIQSNIMAIGLFFIVALPFAVISQIYAPQLTYLPLLGCLNIALALLFNWAKLHLLGRSLIVLFPTILASVFAAFLVSAGEPPFVSMMMLIFSFSLLPALAFDLRRETYFLAGIFLVNSGFILFFQALNSNFEIEIEASVFKDGWVSVLTMCVSLAIAFGSLISLAYFNYESETKLDEVLSQVRAQNQQLVTSEKELNRKVDELSKKSHEEEQYAWRTSGLAKFSEILRENHEDMETLSYRTISSLVTYLGANQGGLFITNDDEENPVLNLTGMYAYERRKYMTKVIHPGEGLVGQCWQEGLKIFMTRVPDNYITIKSGLGDSSPGCVLIVPMKVNDKIYGIVEVASFKVFEDFEIEFVEKVAESIAATISTVKVNLQTARLLEDAQTMSQRLKAQEEELRQNAEEMMATQEELQRRIEELESQEE